MKIKMKKRTPKQITNAGMTLVAGMVFLPFIPFKKTTSKKKINSHTKV